MENIFFWLALFLIDVFSPLNSKQLRSTLFRSNGKLSYLEFIKVRKSNKNNQIDNWRSNRNKQIFMCDIEGEIFVDINLWSVGRWKREKKTFWFIFLRPFFICSHFREVYFVLFISFSVYQLIRFFSCLNINYLNRNRRFAHPSNRFSFSIFQFGGNTWNKNKLKIFS